MGKGGGGGGSQTVNTQVEPPAYAKPFLEFGLAEAKEQYMGDMPGYYPGSTVVGFAPESQLALNMVRDRALAGSPLISGAQNTIGNFAGSGGGLGAGADVFRRAALGGLGNEALPFARGVAGGANLGEAIDMTRATARGDFLSGSPGLQGAIDRALDPVQDRIQSQFARAGRMGSGANQEVLTRGLSDAASNIAYQDYSRERQNQLAAQQNLAGLQAQQFGTQLSGLNALGALSGQDLARRMSGASALSAADQARMQRQLAGLGGQASTSAQDLARRMQGAQLAPQFADLDYQGAERLAAVGGAREQQAQAELQDSVNRYNFDQNVDAQKLRDYMALIGGGTVGSQSSQPVFRNPLASGLGGALGGAQLGSMAGFNPMYGAIGGGLLSLLGG
jgi:hypothetical protein